MTTGWRKRKPGRYGRSSRYTELSQFVDGLRDCLGLSPLYARKEVDERSDLQRFYVIPTPEPVPVGRRR